MEKNFEKKIDTYRKVEEELKTACTDYLKSKLEKNGGSISFAENDIDCQCVSYDGGGHPECNSNVFASVYEIHLDKKGNVCLSIDEDDNYPIERVFDCGSVGEIVSICETIEEEFSD